MKIGILVAGVLAAAMVAGAANGTSLPIAKRTYTDKSKYWDIEIAYPQTGMKPIDDDLARSVRDYADQFKKLARDSYDEKLGTDTLDTDMTVVRNDASVFAVLFESEVDMHGAHPNQELWTANYFRADGWRFYLPELFDAPRALPMIAAVTRGDLDRRITQGADSMSDKDTVAMGTDPVAYNFKVFALMPDRIHFWFPPYQVAAYAAGPQESDVPLGMLNRYFRTNPRAPAASFDCAKAAKPDERAICSDVGLARLDREVADSYGEALRDSTDDKDKAAKRDAQRAWLAHRDDTCKAAMGPALVACLSGVLKARLAALSPE